MKTLFITLNRGILVRNFLHTPFWGHLMNVPDLRVVIFLFSMRKDVPLPAGFLEEINKNGNVIVEVIPNKNFGVLRALWYELTLNLVFTATRKIHIKYGSSKVKPKSFFYRLFLTIIFTPLSKIPSLKRFVRWVEFFFSDHQLEKYFKMYNPDLVFATTILSKNDLMFLKTAHRLNIPTIAMPKSWDNLDKMLLNFEPDLFLVQNELMKKDAVRYQAFHPERVKTIGFVQFDLYHDNSVIISREEYCRKRGFNPKLPILFLGSEGPWSPGDDRQFKSIYDARENGKIPQCNILIRPYFNSYGSHAYTEFKKLHNVYVDDTSRTSAFFGDDWNPSDQDVIDFTNTLYHMDAIVTYASTLVLDAVCFDKPIVNIAFGVRSGRGRKKNEDWSHIMYELGFYQEVTEPNATVIVRSEQDLFEAISQAILNPAAKIKERARLREKMCYKLDGKAGERLVEEIKRMLTIKKQ